MLEKDKRAEMRKGKENKAVFRILLKLIIHIIVNNSLCILITIKAWRGDRSIGPFFCQRFCEPKFSLSSCYKKKRKELVEENLEKQILTTLAHLLDGNSAMERQTA